MNMNRQMLVRIKIENESKIFNNLWHNQQLANGFTLYLLFQIFKSNAGNFPFPNGFNFPQTCLNSLH